MLHNINQLRSSLKYFFTMYRSQVKTCFQYKFRNGNLIVCCLMHQKPKDVKHKTTEKAFWWCHRPDPYPTPRSRNPKSVHIGGVSLGSDTGSKIKHIVCTMHTLPLLKATKLPQKHSLWILMATDFWIAKTTWS